MKFFPRWGSNNIDLPLPHNRQKWEYKDCGYIGAFIIVDGKLAEVIHNEYLKNKDKSLSE